MHTRTDSPQPPTDCRCAAGASGTRGMPYQTDTMPVTTPLAHPANANTIESLQALQARYGYLPRAALDALAATSGTPVARLYGVATFYANFRLEPPGRHTVRLCHGTACHVRGASRLLDAIERRFGVADGDTTSDGRFTLETVACLGTCYLAPVMAVDDRYFGNVTPDRAIAVLEDLT